MPRRSADAVGKIKQKIQQAALKLFTKQGFHGTTVREIARAARVSMGKLYLYYPTKEDIFIGLVQQMEEKMEAIRREEILPLMASPEPENLRKLGMAVGRVVRANLDYWRLMYVDVVEFRHKHFIHSFQKVAAELRAYARGLFQTAPTPFHAGIDPGFAYTTLYLQILTYFLAEELFGAKRHLGVSDEEAVEHFVRLYTKRNESEG
jgi:AcrR family transcriptional regulator